MANEVSRDGKASSHEDEYRPWGHFSIIRSEENYKLKKIVILPGHRISYQTHAKRSECWVLVKGEAVVTLDGVDSEMKIGHPVYIPVNVKHRISNRGLKDVVFIEVQTGEYFGEDDIIRYQDDYDRT